MVWHPDPTLPGGGYWQKEKESHRYLAATRLPTTCGHSLTISERCGYCGRLV